MSSSSRQNVPSRRIASAPSTSPSTPSSEPSAVATTTVRPLARSRTRSATLSSGEGSRRPTRWTGSFPATGSAVIADAHGVEHHLAPELEIRPRHLIGRARERAKDGVALHEARAHARRRQQVQRLRLAERQEADDVVEIPVGERDGRDRGVAGRARPEPVEALDVAQDVRRGVDEQLRAALDTDGADGDRVLRARRDARVPRPGERAVVAAAVPLGKAAPRTGAEHLNAHGLQIYRRAAPAATGPRRRGATGAARDALPDAPRDARRDAPRDRLAQALATYVTRVLDGPARRRLSSGVEQLFRKQQVSSSNLEVGSSNPAGLGRPLAAARGQPRSVGPGRAGRPLYAACRAWPRPAICVAASRLMAMIECCGFTPRLVGKTLESTT